MARISFLEDAYAKTRDVHKQTAKDLYTKVWAADAYGATDDFVERTAPRIVEAINSFYPVRADRSRPTVIDSGCGKGIFLDYLTRTHAVSVRSFGVDIIKQPGLPGGLEVFEQALWEPLPDGFRADFSISTDALEHVPPELVADTLAVIRGAAPHGWHRISTRKDSVGLRFGTPLHLTVQPPGWWLAKFEAAGITPRLYRVESGTSIEIQY